MFGIHFVSPEERELRAKEPPHASWPETERGVVERELARATPEALAVELSEWPLAADGVSSRAADVRRHDVDVELPSGGPISAAIAERIKAAVERVRLIASLHAYLFERYRIAGRQGREGGAVFDYDTAIYGELLRRQPAWLEEAKTARDALLKTLKERRGELAKADRAWESSGAPFFPAENPSEDIVALWERLARAAAELVAASTAIKAAAFKRAEARGEAKRTAAAFGVEYRDGSFSDRWAVTNIERAIAAQAQKSLEAAGAAASALAGLFR